MAFYFFGFWAPVVLALSPRSIYFFSQGVLNSLVVRLQDKKAVRTVGFCEKGVGALPAIVMGALDERLCISRSAV